MSDVVRESHRTRVICQKVAYLNLPLPKALKFELARMSREVEEASWERVVDREGNFMPDDGGRTPVSFR